MSIRKVHSRNGIQFLGNINTTEVHDLLHERSQCQIDEILSAGHAVGFNPDSLDEAHRNGYDNCAYCIGGSHR